MNLVEVILIAVGLSMDAFAVAICKGLSVKQLLPRHYLITGLWFGGFQGLMPLLGFLLGRGLENYIKSVDHWIAFGLLALIGLNMLRESRNPSCDVPAGSATLDQAFAPGTMLPLALATSIDALAIGVSLGLLDQVNIGLTSTIIGVITFAFSALGLGLGRILGEKFQQKAQIVGGIVLISLGLKILLEHLAII